MNVVILIGRLTRDPELSYTASNTAKCVFSLAVDRPRRDGENTGADFIRVIVWGRQAETSDRYLYKGSQCAVLGSIRTGSYKNRDGRTIYTTDVWAERVKFLGERRAESHEEPYDDSFDDTFDTFDDLPMTFSATDEEIPF